MKKILLLNLPWDERYLREYYCSKISKAKYYYAPVDLVYTTWWFEEAKYETIVIDAILENYSNDTVIDKIIHLKPDYVIFLSSSASFRNDINFFNELKIKLNNDNKIKFIWLWDIFKELKKDSFIQYPLLDAICLNFASKSVINYIENSNGDEIDNMIYKYKGKIIEWNLKFDTWFWNVPQPKWSLFNLGKYSHPFAIKWKNQVVLTDFWCPYTCTFCAMSNLKYIERPLDEVLKELYTLNKLWVKDIFFIDNTFWIKKDRLKKICDFLKNTWIIRSCFSRVDLVNEEMIKYMSKSWCYAIIFWIESANEDILKQYKKNTKIIQMQGAMNLCKKHGIRVWGTFIIWLPWENKESVLNTINFSLKLWLDYASFNIATPRIWAHFREDMIKQWLVDPKELNLESTKQKTNAWKKNNLTHKELMHIQKMANRKFYLRFNYLFSKLIKLKSRYEFYNSIIEAYYIFFKK